MKLASKGGEVDTHKGARVSSPKTAELEWTAHRHVSESYWAHALSFRCHPGPKLSKGWGQEPINTVDVNTRSGCRDRLDEQVTGPMVDVETISADLILADEGSRKADSILASDMEGAEIVGVYVR